LWSAIHYFYPYTRLIGDWDAALAGSIPRLIAAKDADQYAKTVLALDAHVEDGHANARGHPSIATLFGTWSVPLSVRFFEGQYVVAGTYGKGSVAALEIRDARGLRRGKTVMRIDERAISQAEHTCVSTKSPRFYFEEFACASSAYMHDRPQIDATSETQAPSQDTAQQ
jgi:hypothetical protein